ncbi:MAG: phosphoribosylformylglycinamidine synthase I [Alphaproteobacteria bacterium]
MTASVLVLSGYGLNCEEETLHAFDRAGVKGVIRHINDLIDAPRELESVQILAVPGGFSYGDDTGSGNAFAQKMKLSLWDHLRRFVERDTLTIGICNGCQILSNLGLVPGIDGKYGERTVAVTYNASARYQCRWVDVKTAATKSPWMAGIDKMHIPVAHGEGRFMMDDGVLETLKKNGQIALQYIKDGKSANSEFPYNPNGSLDDIAGITDETGRVLALMPHPERGMFTWQRDDYDRLKDRAQREGKTLPEEADGIAIFKNAARYFVG